MDMLDYSKNYNWGDLGIKTKKIEWAIEAEQKADTVALELDKYLELKINWTTYKVWIVV